MHKRVSQIKSLEKTQIKERDMMNLKKMKYQVNRTCLITKTPSIVFGLR